MVVVMVVCGAYTGSTAGRSCDRHTSCWAWQHNSTVHALCPRTMGAGHVVQVGVAVSTCAGRMVRGWVRVVWLAQLHIVTNHPGLCLGSAAP